MTTTVDAGLYMRLSVEDETNNESTSIQTQRAMLMDHCRERGYRIVDCYVDDGQTGTNFERPEFQRMLRDIEAGKINTVICKDLSRFGRNYYEAGMYLEKYFVERNIRFIAIQDNVDSAKGGYDLTVPFLNMMNDYYARGISTKTKVAKQTRAKQGMFLGSKAPYGYQKDPADRHHLVIDEETAEVVRKIYALYLSGLSCKMIAEQLTQGSIPTPSQMKKRRGEDLGRKDCTRWSAGTVRRILRNPVYLGHMVQGKEEKISFKEKATHELPENRWFVVQNTHEAIIKQDIFERTGRMLKKKAAPAERTEGGNEI
jgi:DNA invertase Pin-like site-specific DNA recombinase